MGLVKINVDATTSKNSNKVVAATGNFLGESALVIRGL
jgi:hypothetical protein